MGTDSDILQVQGIHSKGFGIVPKMVMQDERLSIQAKAIYSYFCSYAGAGKTAFPQRNKIIKDLRISKDSYYRHFKQLKEFGYIKVEQEKAGNGKFSRNIFTLVENVPCPNNQHTTDRQIVMPKENIPCPKLTDTEETRMSPCPKKPYTEKPYMENKDTKNNTIIKITEIKNNSLSSQTVNIDGYTKIIHRNIQYEDLKLTNHDDIALIDEIVYIMLDAIISRNETVRIGGEEKPRELLRHQLLRITNEDIKHVLWQFKSITKCIKNKKQYLLTMLYHSRLELEAHYTNLMIQEIL